MSPTEHKLTGEELQIITAAFAILPPLHRQTLMQHLKSISFLDNMPNTELTTTIIKDKDFNLYHITFRAGILHQTISQWLTEKERTCYLENDTTYSVSLNGGSLSALTYILLHEGAHVVDGSLHLLNDDLINESPQSNTFMQGFINGV